MAEDIDLHLGRRLRRRRRLVGLTQQQLASRVGVRFQQIQKYECGANRLSAARLWMLAEALDVPIGYFFDGLGDRAGGSDAGGSESAAERPAAENPRFHNSGHEEARAGLRAWPGRV